MLFTPFPLAAFSLTSVSKAPIHDTKPYIALHASSTAINDEIVPREPISSDGDIIANKGKTATFMLAWPSITTFTLVKGWNEDTTQQLRNAVGTVVHRNPILTGRAQMSSFFNTKISIKPGKYPSDSHSFVNEIIPEALPASVTEKLIAQEMNETEVLQFMDDFLAPLVPPAESVIESIQSGGPLFGIDVIKLPGDYACYFVRMSHCVGDGVTYYNILSEIDHEMNPNRHKNNNRHEMPSLIWDDPAIASHEIFPQRFSEGDIQKAYGLGFTLGLLRNAWHIKRQRKDYIILNKQKIEQKRKALSALSPCNGYLSANDIITSAICSANKSSSIFAFTMNMRDRHCHYGGNYHNEIPFLSSAAKDPYEFRSIVKKGYYYEKDVLPLCPFVVGKV